MTTQKWTSVLLWAVSGASGVALLAAVLSSFGVGALAGAAPSPSAESVVSTSRVADTPSSAEGYIADAETVSPSASSPAVSRLEPALLRAVRAAAAEAESQGVTLGVASGWRAPEYQTWLLERAVQSYGSWEEARRWVGTAQTSRHVAGEAVDIGPYASADWLERKGAAFGLCRTYENEAWHFERVPDAVGKGCPAMYPDAAHDPRFPR